MANLPTLMTNNSSCSNLWVLQVPTYLSLVQKVLLVYVKTNFSAVKIPRFLKCFVKPEKKRLRQSQLT